MSIDLAEKLKQTLTDKFVLVDPSIPELKRFANWTGRVKTVNMNCRAIVQFDGPVDISWYDIDPAYLTVVDAPLKRAEQPPSSKAPATKPVPVLKSASGSGKNPLDAIRSQQAAKSGTSVPVTAGAKPSPLDLIRKQGAIKAESNAVTSAIATTAVTLSEQKTPVEVNRPSVSPTQKTAVLTLGADGRPLSKLELIRQQGAMKKS
jgi:hypothetical protein